MRTGVDLAFRDETVLQTSALPHVKAEGHLVCVPEIEEACPTQRWADACISDIRLFGP